MIRLALQKSGRLTEKSVDLLNRCGLEFNWSKNRLVSRATNFPLELMLVRDDDIPEYVREGVCDIGLVGENVLYENLQEGALNPTVERELGFGRCRLSFAVPEAFDYQGIQSLRGRKIATSYPGILGRYLREKSLDAHVIEISGSVEITPVLGVADVILDLVSTGSTLRSNNLKEVETLMESQCVLVRTPEPLSSEKSALIDRLLRRLDGVKKAEHNKYIMMNATRTSLPKIREVLPGLEQPTVMPLDGDGDRLAVHAVCHEDIFWETMEGLEEAGATSILVVPIEKIL